MTKKRKKLATLTPEEDRAWVQALNFHLEHGDTISRADRLAWQEACERFPRLREYDGAKR